MFRSSSQVLNVVGKRPGPTVPEAVRRRNSLEHPFVDEVRTLLKISKQLIY
jgi:hypothetical protein